MSKWVGVFAFSFLFGSFVARIAIASLGGDDEPEPGHEYDIEHHHSGIADFFWIEATDPDGIDHWCAVVMTNRNASGEGAGVWCYAQRPR